jgi:4-amino-4-deoxy-L-arabinose transferase-like glycosyltransferase
MTSLGSERQPSPETSPSADGGRELTVDLFVLLGITLLVRLINLDHTVFMDEVFHLLAASSLVSEGHLQLPSGEAYTRARVVTYLAAVSYYFFGESIVAARIPSVLAGSALVLVLFLWVRRVAGRPSAWVAAGLFSLAPQAIYHSQIVRMYSYQALFVLITAWASYELVMRAGLARHRVALLIATASLGAFLSLWAQIASAVALGAIACWFVVMAGLSPAGRAFVARTDWRILGGLVIAAGLAAALAVTSGFPTRALELFRHADLWASGPEENVLFYHYSFWEHFPVFWSLFPILALVALARRFYAASLCLAAFSAIFLAHSFAAWKVDRYVFYSLPFFFAVVGMALGPVIPWLVRETETLVRPLSRPGLIRVASVALLAAGLLFALRNNPAYRYSYDMVTGSDATWTHDRRYRGESDWRALAEYLGDAVDEVHVVVESSEPKAEYFLGRSDYSIASNSLAASWGTLPEFSPTHNSNTLLVSRPESVAWILDCHPSGLIIIEQHRWRQFWGVPDDTADLIEARTSRIDLPDAWRLQVYEWRSAHKRGGDAMEDVRCSPPSELRTLYPDIPEHGR